MKIIILAGGMGTRLWPFSSPPKQFLSFNHSKWSLLQKTIQRFLAMFSPKDLLIVTKAPFLSLAQEQAKEVAEELFERVIAEPFSKNTSTALLFALKWLENHQEDDPYFLMTPADHLLEPQTFFLQKLQFAQEQIAPKKHLLFGVFPTSPHTGYGYIQCDVTQSIAKVESFLEKPLLAKAEQLLLSGEFLWNTGILLCHKESFLEELGLYQESLSKAYKEEDFSLCPSLSIDHAFLEYSENLEVIPLSLSWSDVGTWESLYDLSVKDQRGNVLSGPVWERNAKNCLVLAEQQQIAVIGVEDLVIVEREGAILVAKRGESHLVSHHIHTAYEEKVFPNT